MIRTLVVTAPPEARPRPNILCRQVSKLGDRLAALRAEVERWRNVTARKDPDDCAAGIKELFDRWKKAEAELAAARADAERMRDLLVLARKYEAEGEDGAPLPRRYWTPDYTDYRDRLDAAVARAEGNL